MQNVRPWGGGRKRAAIVVNNNDIDVTAITQVSHEDAILIEIRYKGAKLFGTSLYLPIDRDIAISRPLRKSCS
jgi:hypothetical protein